MTLDKLEMGKSAVITKVGGEGALRARLLDMGLIPRTVITAVRRAPMGDPIELRVRGYELTIRLEDAAKIEIEPAEIPRVFSSDCASCADCCHKKNCKGGK